MDHVAFVGSAAPFVARVGQLERLRELMALALSGTATGVIIGGDAGVGKTRTIVEAGHHAAATGFQVLTGRCVDLGMGSLPYLPFAEALSQPLRWGERDGIAQQGVAQVVREVAAERPGLAQIIGSATDAAPRSLGEAGLDRLALFESVTHLLGRISGEVAPVLLVLEDLHWADASTRDLIRFLFSRLGPDRLLVLASVRNDDLHRRHPLRPLMGELARLPRVEQMHLPPLSGAELADLLAGVSGSPVKPALLRRIVARSAGNPYYAQEILAAGEDGRLPEGLTDLLLERLEQLSEPAQRVVRLASVLGSARIEDSLLRAVAGGDDTSAPLSGDDLELALREAIAQQVLVPEEMDRYRFRHALLQEAVYSDLLPGERVRLHKAVATRLKPVIGTPGARGVAAAVARHSLAANDMPSALNASLQAARFAARGNAPAEALQHYEQALQLWDVVPEEQRSERIPRDEVSLRAADVASDAGLHDRAVGLAAAATQEAEAAGDFAAAAKARASLSLHTYLVDRPREAREHAMRVIGELTDSDAPSPARALAWAMVARIHLGFGEPGDAIKAVLPALAESEALGMTALQVDLFTTQAVAEGMLRRDEESARSYRLAQAAAELSDDTAGTVRVLYNIAINHLDQGDLAAGISDLQAAIAVADANGLAASMYGANTRRLLITTLWHVGDVEGALKVVRPDAGATRLPMSLVTHLRLIELPVVAARDPEEVLRADEWLVIGDDTWERQVVHTARAEALAWLGQWEEAAAQTRLALDYVLSDAEPWHLSGIAIDARGISVLADGAELARAAGDQVRLQSIFTEIESFLEDGRTRGRLGLPRRGVMGPEGRAWLARLELEWARAQGEDRSTGWIELAEAFESVSVYEVARARWRAAGALVREGCRAEADEQILLAHRTASRLGARPLLRRLEDLAQQTGLTLPSLPVDGLPAGSSSGDAQMPAEARPAHASVPATEAANQRNSYGRDTSSQSPATSVAVKPEHAPGLPSTSGLPTANAEQTKSAPESEAADSAVRTAPSLTPREQEVMSLVAAGLTNRAIGERLYISEKTASVHVSNVLAKLSASGRAEAVAILSRLGLIS
ncbi:LuxR family transcriptional regulator [Kineosporia sp. NBRC 101677]|uniref:helix-turn-helix transcriptional regulator n=1 Tax=Kineosporia sp. NBRC 101677 TaxID=3032197 RepID=UPI0024A1F803|nr:LuxR family transcriptional regulator [Kineosporia sp. NBRC 101677]GLY17611.1 LuxR family transcriptional regulator [Kineosporia sp. NBRC 101677]